jgi:hypothetical protein
MFLVGQLCGKGGQSHILRGSKGVGVTIESDGKVEISHINVDNFCHFENVRHLENFQNAELLL